MPQQDIQKSKEQKAEEHEARSEWSNSRNKALGEWYGRDKALNSLLTSKSRALGEWYLANEKIKSDLAKGRIDQKTADAQSRASTALHDKIEAEYDVQYDKIDAPYHAKYAEAEKKFDAEFKKAEAAIWKKYGWSQEKEEAYEQQEFDKWKAKRKAEYPDPVEADPKANVTKKPTDESAEVKEVRKAIKAYLNDRAVFDSTLKSTRIKKIKEADDKTDKINVLTQAFSEAFAGGVVTVSSNGDVGSYNGVKLHLMGELDSDISKALDEVRRFVRENDANFLKQDNRLESFARTASAVYDKQSNRPTYSIIDDAAKGNLVAIVLDDNKHVLVANDRGGYEVLHIKPDASLPSQQVGQAQSPAKGPAVKK